MKPTLSIIIPTLNEEKYLPQLLKSIKKQDFKDYEVIVADYNSKDNTRAIAKKFGCKITKGGRPAAGRNNGAKIAGGDNLLFLDGDVILPKNFLRNMLSKFREKNLDVATCFVVPDSKNIIDHFNFFFANIFIWIVQFFNPHAPGFCLLVKKKVHDRVKGFDETIFIAEDHDYVKRICKFGKFKILCCWVKFSTRRFEKEGRLKLVLKYLYFSLYRMLKGEVKKEIIKYDFGVYGKK